MDSPNSQDSPLAARSTNNGEPVVQKRRGRPPGSGGKARVSSGSRVVKSTASRQTPDQTRSRYASGASLPGGVFLFPNNETEVSPPSTVGGSSTTKSITDNVTPLSGSFIESEEEPETPETDPSPSLLRSSASSPEVPQALRAQRYEDASDGRPKELRKSKSESSAQNQELTPSQIDSMIAAALRQPLTKTETTRKNVGNNYVFQITPTLDNVEEIVKVGYTKGPEKTRLDNIKSKCDPGEFRHDEDPEHVPIRLYERAEKLAQKELGGFLYKFECECGTAHREYFAIDPNIARDAVRRWRGFCRQEPYDSQGHLREFWEHRIRNMQRWKESETIHDHDKRAERWKRFMSPTDFDKIQFDLIRLRDKLWGFRWQGLAVVESYVIVLLTFPSLSAVLYFGSICLWFIVELLELELPLVLEVIQKKMSGYRRIYQKSVTSINE